MENKQLIDLCQECHDTCLDMLVNFCYVKGGDYTASKHLMIMGDCIEICESTANFLRRNSSHAGEVCAPCANICFDCADSCASLQSKEMQQCADICRKCAQSCEELAGVKQFA